MKKIETKKLKFVNDKTLIATVDIGKGLNMGYARCPDHSEVKPFEFANNRAGFDKFWDCLEKARDAKSLEHRRWIRVDGRVWRAFAAFFEEQAGAPGTG